MSYRAFFGLAGEPFRADLDLDAILQTDDLLSVHERLQYTVRLGAIALVTGEVGAGKSTALRWAAGQLHPSKYKTLWITASSGSILEVYRQLLAELDIHTASSSRAVLTRRIREQIANLVNTKKQQPLLVIDEAQKVKDIGLNIKLILDNISGIKVVASGSSSFDLAQQLGEPLTGRKYTLHMFPLAQLELSAVQSRAKTDALLESRLIYGSYPEVVLFNDDSKTMLYKYSCNPFLELLNTR